jgi:hypothetical protein
MIPRNTYFGDSLRSWDLRLTRNFHVREKQELALSIDAFNVLNRPNVDEITPVYGSPVFCGNAIPQRYNDATSLAIQHGGVTCPVGDGLAIPGQGSFASTPITTAAGQTCLPPSATCIFIPASPNATFGLPRTMFNARQFQFAAKYTF